jgi:polysaccharide export outer membrane protein
MTGSNQGRLIVMGLALGLAAVGQTVQTASLPSQKLGPDDLISVQVRDFQEFSRTVRVSTEGAISLPLIKREIAVAGRFPTEIESAISDELRTEDLVLNPMVSVSVIEYAGRPVSVLGAVRSPVTFQVVGRVTLVEAIVRAGGLSIDAGPEILVLHTRNAAQDSGAPYVQHISTHTLMNEDTNKSNVMLTGGEEIRVPAAGRVYVLGDVKNPGAFLIQDNMDVTVLTALALSGGLGQFPASSAFIVRRDEVTGTKQKLPIELKAILARKAPDYPLLPDDVLFIPSDAAKKQTLAILDRIATAGASIATGLIILNK